VTDQFPKGFIANGVQCGIKEKKDLGFILSDTVCQVAGVTTQSTTAAPCVHYVRDVIKKGIARLLIVNSGNANAFNGEQGEIDLKETVSIACNQFDIPEREVLVASTGIIGKKLPMDKIKNGLEQLAVINGSNQLAFLEAIKTTDLNDKIVSRKIEYQNKEVVITGMAKGSGMIHPQMATMLGFIMTDVVIDNIQLQKLVEDFNRDTFNMISVDGDTSTNDMVLVMSNGQSKVDYQDIKNEFNQKLQEVFIYLAKEIARDGEGATKLIEVNIKGAASDKEARATARKISGSPLVKSAIYGESENIGRLVAAIGASGSKVNMQDLKVDWVGVKSPEVIITVDLAVGDYTATAWGCDLTEDYIKINTDYN